MTDSSTQSIEIAAPAAAVAEVILDFPQYPEWVSAVTAIEVIEEYPDGRPSQVRFSLDAGVLKDEYILEYRYDEELTHIEWSLVERSQVQKSQEGSYDLAEQDGMTTVTYTLAVELSIPMLGMFKRKAEKMIMDTALKELKRRVDSLGEAQ